MDDTDQLNLKNPLTIVDSNNDGISDADAIALGLDPNDLDGDTDDDGISDVVETGSDPGNPLALDSDADGVIDARENGANATDANIASGLLLSNGDQVTVSSSAGEMLSKVYAAATVNPPSGVNFPFGSVGYTSSSTLGGNVTIRLVFSTDLPILLAQFTVTGSDNFKELSSGLWTLVDARTIDITLTDGDPSTDLDGLVNRSITHSVAPAEQLPVASSGGNGCTVINTNPKHPDPMFPILLLVAFGYWIHKRHC